MVLDSGQTSFMLSGVVLHLVRSFVVDGGASFRHSCVIWAGQQDMAGSSN